MSSHEEEAKEQGWPDCKCGHSAYDHNTVVDGKQYHLGYACNHCSCEAYRKAAARPPVMPRREYKKDAIRRGFYPGALVERQLGCPSPVLLTSWPIPDAAGATIMARTDPTDPLTNICIAYETLVRKIGEAPLDA